MPSLLSFSFHVWFQKWSMLDLHIVNLWEYFRDKAKAARVSFSKNGKCACFMSGEDEMWGPFGRLYHLTDFFPLRTPDRSGTCIWSVVKYGECKVNKYSINLRTHRSFCFWFIITNLASPPQRQKKKNTYKIMLQPCQPPSGFIHSARANVFSLGRFAI